MGRHGRQIVGVAEEDLFPLIYDQSAPLQTQLMQFMECLPLLSGRLHKPNAKVKLERWQKDLIKKIYPKRGKAKTLAVASLPRKQGKSNFAIFMIAAALFGCLQESSGEIIGVASNKDQADQLFRILLNMLKKMPDTLAKLNVEIFKRTITNLENDTIFYIAAHDESILGRNPSLIVADECGSWKETANKGKKVWDALITSQGSRSQPLLLAISTQAPDDNHWFSKEVVDYVLQVNDKVIKDNSATGVVYAAPKGCKLNDESAWRTAMPSLGTLVSLDYVRTQARQALLLPSKRNAFRAFMLNQRVNRETSKYQELFNRDLWMACRKDYTADLLELREQPCFLGIDLASRIDQSAIVCFFADTCHTLAYVYAAGITARQNRNKGLFETWEHEGEITICEETIEPRMILEQLLVLCETYNVQGIYYDPYGIAELQRLIDEEGATLPDMTPVKQGYLSLGEPMKKLIELVTTKSLKWNSPVLSWHVMNARCKMDNNKNVIPTKQRSIDSIDSCSALVNAIYGYMRIKLEPLPALMTL